MFYSQICRAVIYLLNKILRKVMNFSRFSAIIDKITIELKIFSVTFYDTVKEYN